jgi:hypothetical protein
MTRKEYYKMAVNVLTTEEFVKKFDFEPVDFEELVWDYNLETAYNEYMAYLDDDDLQEDFEEALISGNMFCDDTGFCSGSSCPNFYKCHG